MYKSIKTRFNLYESAVFFDLYHCTLYDLTYFVLVVDYRPRLRLILLVSERNLSLFLVHLEYDNFNLVSNCEHFLRVSQFSPRNFRNMKESVDTTDINKCAVICKSHYSTFDNISYFETAPNFGDLLCSFFRQNSFVREHCSSFHLVDAVYFYIESLSDEFIRCFHKLVRKLWKRNKSCHFLIRGNHSAIYGSRNFYINNRFIFKSFYNFIPVSIDFELFLWQNNLAVVSS